MAAYSQDDSFHEIQLNGKQLVFLFMAATVVSVVIFLCGVLVGRGVRAERGDLADAGTGGAAAIEVAPAIPADVARTPAATTGTPAPTPAPVDELSYFDRLEKPTTPPETLSKPSPEVVKPAPAPAAAEKKPAAADKKGVRPQSPPAPRSAAVSAAATSTASPAATTTPPAATTTPSSAAATTPPAAKASVDADDAPSSTFAVQVAALNVRTEADAMARRLTAKGYAAYVVSPPSGRPSVFRVRVGSYKTRREAEDMAARLQKEEQIKPWVTR